MLGGNLRVDSSPGSSTRVEVEEPSTDGHSIPAEGALS
jgi:hypothetical protein